MANLITTDNNKTGFSIEPNGNVLLFGTDYIGCICQKSEGRWTAYSSTEAVIGQYGSDIEAATAVDEAHSKECSEGLLSLFDEVDDVDPATQARADAEAILELFMD